MDMHPEDIKAAIRKRGGTLAALARSAGVSTQALSAALATRSSARLEIFVAKFLGTPPHQIWPSRYNNAGARILFTTAKTERSAA